MLGPSVSLKMTEVWLVTCYSSLQNLIDLNMLCTTHEREMRKQLESIFKTSGDRKRY